MRVMLYGSPVGYLREGLNARLGDISFVEAEYTDSDDVLSEGLKGCDAIVAVRIDRPGLVPESVRLIQVPGIGIDEIKVNDLPSWVTLCNVGEHGPAVAEYVIGTLLARAMGLCGTDRAFRNGSWEASSRMGGAPHDELFGASVGIVGFGNIGQEIAMRLKPFGVQVNVCNRSKITAVDQIDRFWPLMELKDMAARCDFLVITVAQTPETEGLIGSDLIGAMPKGSVLVNVARGPVVDEDALHEALVTGHLGGAVLDVWWRYPDATDDANMRPSHHDFSQFPGVIVTPHISGWSSGTVSRRLDAMADNLNSVFEGQAPSNVVRGGQ